MHARFDEALRRLALRAPDAPLCVIAHSLGSVIASDHFYDLHKGRTLDPEASPLERGETLDVLLHAGQPDRAVGGALRRLQPPGDHSGRRTARIRWSPRPRNGSTSTTRTTCWPSRSRGSARTTTPRWTRTARCRWGRCHRDVAGLTRGVLERRGGDPADRAEPGLVVERVAEGDSARRETGGRNSDVRSTRHSRQPATRGRCRRSVLERLPYHCSAAVGPASPRRGPREQSGLLRPPARAHRVLHARRRGPARPAVRAHRRDGHAGPGHDRPRQRLRRARLLPPGPARRGEPDHRPGGLRHPEHLPVRQDPGALGRGRRRRRLRGRRVHPHDAAVGDRRRACTTCSGSPPGPRWRATSTSRGPTGSCCRVRQRADRHHRLPVR